MKILIDNGHGRETPGKRSPDGRLLEYAQNASLPAASWTASPPGASTQPSSSPNPPTSPFPSAAAA